MIAELIQDPKNYIENPAMPWGNDAWGQLPQLASTFGKVDGLFYFTYAVCIFFFVLITGVLGYSVVKYRRRTIDQPAVSTVTHNTPLEVVWTVIPLIIVMVMFAWGWFGSLDMTVVPADARLYKATAKQWNWTFNYPNDSTPSFGEVWLEVGKPAAFTLESSDVLHAFYVPAMRIKRDVIPGRNQITWFQPTEIGDFHLFCAEYCGKDHSRMYAIVHVVTADEYARKPWQAWDDSNPVKNGQTLYNTLCASCHTINGAPLVGPSWKNLYTKQGDQVTGAQHEVFMPDGSRQTITVDDAYITESIHQPNAKKVVGFEQNSMTAFPDLDEKRIAAIIAFMKSLAQ